MRVPGTPHYVSEHAVRLRFRVCFRIRFPFGLGFRIRIRIRIGFRIRIRIRVAHRFQTAPCCRWTPHVPCVRVPATLREMPKATSIDDYLASVPDAQREALEKLRQQIRSLVPDCEECISYSMPAFRWHGEVIAGFAATKAGCSYYPFSGTTLATLSDALAPYSRTKSAVHFDAKKGLPTALLKKLIAARKLEIET